MKRAFLVAVLLAACGGPPPGVVVQRKDSSVDGPTDMSMGPPGDFATLPLTARMWADETKQNDTSASLVQMNGALGGVWNTNSTAIAVGDYGTILRKDRGSKWIPDPTTKPSGAALLAVGGRGTTDLFALGVAGAVWKYVGTEWDDMDSPWMGDSPPLADVFRSVWVAPDGLAFAEGDTSIIVRRPSGASSWTKLPTVPGTSEYPDCIWGTMPTPGTYVVYVGGCQFTGSSCDGGGGRIWKTDGNTVSGPETITGGVCDLVFGIWGSSANDLYATCDNGIIIHSTGDGTWTKQNTGLVTTNLLAISGAGPDEIYAVGGPVDMNGVGIGPSVVLHKYNHASDQWSSDTLPTAAMTSTLFSVYATPYDVYAVGSQGLILHK